MSQQYTADSIDVATNLAGIRRRPTGWIVSKGVAGQVHMIREILDNSVDELILRPEGGTIYICMFRDKVLDKYQIVVRDTGRGIPNAALMDVTTILGASGKSGAKSAYTNSAGLFGMGAKVAAALSTRFRVISKNYLDAEAGSILLNDSEVVSHRNELAIIPNGVLTVFEPDLDPKFLIEGKEFMDSGYLDLVAICKQLNIFNENINFQFYVFDRKIPEKFWTAPIQDAYAVIDQIITQKDCSVEYASDTVGDKAAYLFDLWKFNSSVLFQDVYVKEPISEKDRLGFNIKLFFAKKSSTGSSQFFISVNNVALVDKLENSATLAFMTVLRNNLAEHIEEEHLKQFVLTDYRFPTMLAAIGVKYKNAEFSGVTKVSFKDAHFAKQMASDFAALSAMLPEGYWQHVLGLVKPDIELRYSQMYDGPVKKSESRTVFTRLNFPENYKDCVSTDNSVTELYIVEGTSANNIVTTRDKEHQAIYLTRGKPTNVATLFAQMTDNRKKLLADPIYQDLMQLLGISPNTTDMSICRFGKIIICNDADADGYHIRSLHLNNFYILNHRLVENGMVWLANPPLYSMRINKSRSLFLRDKTALMDARVEYIYKPTLEIKVDSNAGVIELTPEAYRDTCYLVNHIGEHFSQVAEQLNIPLLILERLVFAIEHLYPTINLPELVKAFESSDQPGFIRIQTNDVGKFIVISVGHEDYVIGLSSVGDTIVNHLLPLVKKYRCRDYMFLVKSKKNGSSLMQETPMTMMMLYICFSQLNGMFDISRYKGLGEMHPEDCFSTLMNPETRSLTQVTSSGSPEENYALIGKADSTERKKLLTTTTVLSNVFARENVRS